MNIVITIGLIVLVCSMSVRLVGGGNLDKSFFGRDYTTVAKGIAILLIMIGHCSGNWTGGRLMTPCGGVGVAMFLITSGYGLNESYKKSGLKNFWKKRLGRMYIPYALVVLVYALVQQWGWQKVLLNLSCYNSPYWFVTYIVECYIVFWIVSKLVPQHRNVVLMLVSVSTLYLMPELQAEQAFSFVTGVLLSTYKEKIFAMLEDKRTYSIICVTLLIVGVFFLGIKQLPIVRTQANVVEMNLIQSMIKYPLGLHALLAIKSINPILKNPLLHLAGLMSYELYLVHFPFYTQIQERLWPALALIVASFIVAYGFYRMNNWMHNKIVSL